MPDNDTVRQHLPQPFVEFEFDGKNGEQLWRSRKPGDGLSILVNNYLITITKRGKPIAQLGPVPADKRRPLFGYLKNHVVEQGDLVTARLVIRNAFQINNQHAEARYLRAMIFEE